ncbi:sugar-binding protein [Kineosporia rhizophila]|uniref:substrate-binding domain-containing protein n=1 Tax=Kineosporia rhizophila TaxID=84633 RepID=UPI001E353A0C|nr:sugar-binding protein [Kineosporia rhizophila]
MRKILAGLAGVGLALTLTACGSEEIPADSVYANQGALVGISMPTKESERWIADGDAMVEQFKAMGYTTQLEYSDNTAQMQQQQVKSLIDKGSKLLVIAAVDGSQLTDQLKLAASKDIDVIAYDRLLTETQDVGYQATFDNKRVGEMQAQLLVDRLDLNANDDKTYNIEWFAGSKTDRNAKSFYDGNKAILQPYLQSGKVKILSGERSFKVMTTEGYSGKVAQDRMTRLLDEYYQDENVDAVLSPYDGMSIGIINALKEKGYGTAEKPMPVVSGQDAEIPSVQSILNNEQTATIFKDTRELAKVAVEQGNALLTESEPIVNDTTTYDNDVKIVPTYQLNPVQVDKSNYKTLLIDSGYITEEELKAKA